MNKRIQRKIEKRNQRGKSFSIHSGSPSNQPRYTDAQIDNDEAINMLVHEITLLAKEIDIFQKGIIDEHKQALAESQAYSKQEQTDAMKLDRISQALESSKSVE